MKYKSEIFDLFQYLYETTGFSDHQVHCVINFGNKVDAVAMRKAAELLISTIPILSTRYKINGGNSYWEEANTSEWYDLFTITDNKEDFDNFTFSKTNEVTGPQIKFCLFKSDKDALSVVINHMISDAAGFKQCMYLLSDIYSNLVRDPNYQPDYIINGDRGFSNIVKQFSFLQKTKILLFSRKDNNQKSKIEFPFCKTGGISPFIVAHEIPIETSQKIHLYCKNHNVTMNDILLTAYFSALSKKLNMVGKELSIPIMIDMRRYLQDKSFTALTNLSSTTIVKVCVNRDEDFYQTLNKVSLEMNEKKANNLGVSTFLKLDTGFKIPMINTYEVLKRSLKNPKISMTNIGILDSSKLVFKNSIVENAAMFASIKYQPYFQMSVTSYNNRMTLGAGIYGSPEDKKIIEEFFDLMDIELRNIS